MPYVYFNHTFHTAYEYVHPAHVVPESVLVLTATSDGSLMFVALCSMFVPLA